MSFVALPITPKIRGLFAAISVLHACVIVVFALRFFSRYRMKARLGWDDASTTAAIVSSTIMFALYSQCGMNPSFFVCDSRFSQ